MKLEIEKNPLVSLVYTKIIQRFKGWISQVLQVRFGRLKSIPTLKGLNMYNGRRLIA